MTMVQEFPKKIEEKNRILKSARKLSDARDDIIDLFEKGTLPYKGSAFKTKEEESEEESEKELEEKKLEKIKDDYKKSFKYIDDESNDISYKLFKKHFNFEVPTVSAKKLYETKDKKKNNNLVKLIKVRWSNSKDEIKKMSKEEIENEKPNRIL